MHCDILDDNLEKLLDDTSPDYLLIRSSRSIQLVLPSIFLALNDHGDTTLPDS